MGCDFTFCCSCRECKFTGLEGVTITDAPSLAEQIADCEKELAELKAQKAKEDAEAEAKKTPGRKLYDSVVQFWTEEQTVAAMDKFIADEVAKARAEQREKIAEQLEKEASAWDRMRSAGGYRGSDVQYHISNCAGIARRAW